MEKNECIYKENNSWRVRKVYCGVDISFKRKSEDECNNDPIGIILCAEI